MPDLAERAAVLRERLSRARNRADGIREAAKPPPPPPPRRERRVRHRRPWKRKHDPRARPQARHRRLPTGHRASRARKRASAARRHQSAAHRRRSDAEVKRLLAAGGFASFIADSVRQALDDPDRTVIACTCGHLALCPEDKAADSWADHGGSQKPVAAPVTPVAVVRVPVTVSRFERHRLVRRIRRQQRAIEAGGLLARMRDHWADRGWDHSGLAAFGMATRTISNAGGSWNTTGAWVEGVVPTAADDVVATATSGTLTVTAGSLCRSMILTGFTATISGTGSVTIGDASGGACTLAGTVAGSWTTTFAATTDNGGAGWSITSNGKSWVGNVTCNGVGGKWVLQDAFATQSTGGILTLTNGTLDFNSKSWTVGVWSSANSNVRTVTFGSASGTIVGTSTAWNTNTVTNLTVSANTGTATLSGASSSAAMGSKDWNGLSLVFSGSGTQHAQNGFVVANLTRTGTASLFDGLDFSTNCTVTNALALTANSLTNALSVSSSTLGTARTITCNGTVTLTNRVDFSDITGAGAASWNLSASTAGDALGNTGITFTPATTRFAVVAGNWSSTATWSTTSGGGGGASVPLPQDTAVFDANSAAGTYSGDLVRICKDLTCTGFTRTLRWTTGVQIYGSFTLASGMTLSSNAQTVGLFGRSSHTLTSAGKSHTQGVVLFGVTGTYACQDTFTISTASGLSLSSGTFDANNQSVSVLAFSSSNTNTRALLMGSGAWTITAAGATAPWNTTTATGLTVTVSTAIVSCTGAPGSATTVTVTTGGVTMPNWTVNGGANLTVQFADAFTTAGTITLTAAKLDTNSKSVTMGNFAGSGSTARTLTTGSSSITCTATGTAWTTATATNLTFTANTAIVTLNGAGSGASAGGNYNGTSFVLSGSGTSSWGSSGTVANLTRTGTSAKTDILSIAASAAVVSSTLTITGQSLASGNRVLVQSSVLGTARTLTVNGSVVSTNADWQDITAAGTASWNLSGASGGSGDALGNTGITFTPAQTNYWVGGTGSWSDVTRWASTTGGGASSGRVPLPQDTARFDPSSFSGTGQTVTEDMPRVAKDLDFTGVTNTPTFGYSINFNLYGSLTFAASMGRTGTQQVTFSGRGTHTVTMAGQSVPTSIAFAGVGSTYTLQDAFTIAGAGGASFGVSNGTFTANNMSVTTPVVNSNFSTTRTINMGSGTWSLATTSTANAWNFTTTTGLTFNASTSVIAFTGVTTTSRNFIGGGLTYSTLRYSVANSTGPLVITGANVFTTLDFGAGRVITLPSGVTTTATSVVLPGQNYGYVYYPKVNNGSVTTPDSAALSVTGDIDLRARIAPNWPTVGGSNQRVIVKSQTNSTISYRLILPNTGALQLGLSADGTAVTQTNSSVVVPFTGTQLAWIRATWRQSDGRVQFFTADGALSSPQPSDWTQLGTDQTIAIASIFDSNSQVELGTDTNGIASFQGSYYYADIRNNILNDGTGIVGKVDFTDPALFRRPPLSGATFVDTAGNTWTMNGLDTGLITTGEVRFSSSTAGTPFTLSVASGTVTATRVVMKDSTATGGATFNADDSTNVSGNTGWNFRLTGTAMATSSSTGLAAPSRLLQATGSGSSTSTGTSTPERIMPITASGQSTSDGTVTALRLLQASLSAEGTSTGVLVALLDLQAAMAADAVSSGQLQMDRLLQAVLHGQSFSEALLDAVRLHVMTAHATAVSSGQLAAVLRLVVTASGASGTVGELTATRLLRATAAGSSTSVGVLVMLVARYLFGRIQLRPEVTARALHPEVTARTLHPEVDATVGIPAD